MNKIAGYIRSVRTTFSSLSGIIPFVKAGQGFINMREIAIGMDNLDEPQKNALNEKLKKLIQWNVTEEKLESIRDIASLMKEAGRQAHVLFNPEMTVFVQNVAFESVIIGSQGGVLADGALSLSKKTSAILLAQQRNTTLYIPQTNKGKVFLFEPGNKLFESSFKECKIKINKALAKAFKSFVVIPVYYSDESKDPLGSIIVGWRKESALDPVVDLEIARELANFFAISFYRIVVKESLK